MADIEGIRAFLDADETGWNRGFSNAAKTVDDFVSKTGKKLEKVGSELTSIGTKLTASITVPVGAAFAFAVKAASDAVETTSKFQFIFRETSREANAAAMELRNSYGLALTTSQDLLASTGDILQGFGLTAKESLATSLEVQKLAADIASLKNVQGGAAQASEAITRALLGEREMLKSLGIALLESEVKERARIVAVREGIDADSRQARTIASMELITERSANAVGDLARTWDSAANQSRIFNERVKELRENIGQKLLPVYARLLEAGNALIEHWNALSPQTQQQIIYYTSLAAVIGPVVLSLGLFVGVIAKLMLWSSPVLTFLGGLLSGAVALIGPIGATAAVVALLYGAFGNLNPAMETTGQGLTWIQNIFKETAEFWSGVVKNIMGNTKTLTENQRTAVEFIAKIWLGLKFAWNAIQVGIQSVVQTITMALERLLAGFAGVADFVGADKLASGAREASKSLQGFVVKIEDVKEANLATMKEIQDSWGKAPEILRQDVQAFSDTVSELGNQAIAMLKDKTPEAVKAILDLIADINARLQEGPGINIPLNQESSGLAFLRKWEEEQAAKRIKPADFGMQESSGIAFLRGWDAEKTRSALDDIADVWDEWIDNNIESLKNWKETAAGYISGLVTSISDALADAIVYNKNFAKAMVDISKQMASKLISQAIETAIAIIAWDEARAVANGGAEAPSVWLVAAYMAMAAAFFAVGMAGTVAGSSGHGDVGSGGSATISQPAQEPTPVTTVVREPSQEETENRTMRMVVQNDFGDELMAFNVRETKKGRGDGVDRLLTTRDQS